MTESSLPQWHPLTTSSNILGYQYDPEKKVMTVEFKGNSKYDYHDVPKGHFDAFHAAESKGSHFHQHIKNKFETKKQAVMS